MKLCSSHVRNGGPSWITPFEREANKLGRNIGKEPSLDARNGHQPSKPIVEKQ